VAHHHIQLSTTIVGGKTLKKLTTSSCMALAVISTLLVAASAKSLARSTATLTQENRFFTHKEAGIQFELPKGWKAKPDGEVITVSASDDAFQDRLLGSG